MRNARTAGLVALLAMVACGSGGGGAPAVVRASGAVELSGALSLNSKGSILSLPGMNEALNTVEFPINGGSRPPSIEGIYSFQYRYARHTLDPFMVGVEGTMEVAFSNQRPNDVDYALGPAGSHTVVNGFLNGGGPSFSNQPPLDNDFTLVGVIETGDSLLGLPCRARDAIVISGRVTDAGDLKLRMVVMTVRVESDCINALYAAGFDPESIPGAHVIVVGEATLMGP